MKQARKGLPNPDEAQLVHDFDEEPRVEQVAGRVVDAADVLVDRHPVVGDRAIEGRLVVVRIAVAQEVPRGVDEGVHRLRLALPFASAARAWHVQPLRVGRERRDPLRPVVLDLRQQYGQVVLGDRHDSALVAVDDRDRTAPVALPGEAPVP